MPFTNDAVGGITLVRQAIQSPNFVQNPLTGWSIDRNGNAYFESLTLGSGSTFTGTDYIINDNGVFFYSGTPAFNNLMASFTNASGTDAYGNVYLLGVTTYINKGTYFIAVNMNSVGGVSFWTSPDESGVTAWVQMAQMYATNAGDLNILANGSIFLNPGGFGSTRTLILPGTGNSPAWEDNQGNDWQIGRQIAWLTSEFDVTSASLAAITGLSLANLVPGQYKVTMKLYGTNSSVTGVTYTPGFTFGGTMSSVLFNQVNWLTTGQNTTPTQSNGIAVSTLNGFQASPPSTGTSRNCWTEIEGVVTVTARGNLNGACLTSVSADAFHILPGSYLLAEII